MVVVAAVQPFKEERLGRDRRRRGRLNETLGRCVGEKVGEEGKSGVSRFAGGGFHVGYGET